MRTQMIPIAVLMALGAVAAAAEPAAVVNIAKQPVEQTVTALGRQAGVHVVMDPALVKGVMARPVSGKLTFEQAMAAALKDTGLAFEFLDNKTVVLKRAGAGTTSAVAQSGNVSLAQADGVMQGVEGASNQTPTADEGVSDSAIPEILVKGAKTLNTDIKRSPDAAQPYVVFNKDEIQRSGMLNLQDFLKNRLTMGTSATSPGQLNSGLNTSKINLRGLGSDETLILIDGRRAATFGASGEDQPDINGIPLAAVERIEVLPATASGIYGGGATGGVVNIIMRRDYSGVETRLTYGNTFDTDAATRRVDVTSGFDLEGGKTNLLISGSWSDANPLLTQDRDAGPRLRQHLLDTIGYAGLEASGQVPWGATTNIRSTTGAPLTLKGSNQALGATRTYVPYGYAGPASDGGLGLTTHAGAYNLDLADSAQGNAAAAGGRVALVNAPTVETFSSTIRREFSPRVDGFLEFSNSLNAGAFGRTQAISQMTIAAGAAVNPFNEQISVSTPNLDEEIATASVRTLRAVGGVIVKLPGDWSMNLDYTWNKTRQWSYSTPTVNSAAALADVLGGAFEIFRDTNAYATDFSRYSLPRAVTTPGENILRDATVRLGGPLPLSLPGGAPTVTTLLEHRKENIGAQYSSFPRATTATTVTIFRSLYPDLSQEVGSVYMEALLPFVSSRNAVPGIRLLELQLAGRYDKYTTDGASSVDVDGNLQPLTPLLREKNQIHSADPTIALRYQPVSDLTVRASYGTGFLPPSASQLMQITPLFIPNFAGLTDPLRNNELLGFFTLYQGGNPDLVPEESESSSAGVILTPRAAPGLRVSVDWTRIQKKNNIASIAAFMDQGLLNALMDIAPERILRDPPSGGDQYGPIVGIDSSLVNIATLNMRALDFAVDYQFGENRFGAFDLHLGATKLLTLETQIAAGQPVEEYAGVGPAGSVGNSFDGGGLKWRANASLNWRHGGWSLGWTTRFFDSYFFDPTHAINPNQGSASIPSQMYHDLSGGYEFPAGTGLSFLAGTEIQFVINNVFDKEPPLDVVGPGSEASGYSHYGDPRLANYSLSIRKNFGGH